MIKKILVAVAIMLIGSGVANAQFRFGLKAGLLVNKLHFNSSTFDSNNSCGWTVGPMAEFTVPIIGLNFDAGLMYARMNNASNPTEGNTSIENAAFGKNFLEIPINIKYKFSLPVVGSIIKPYLFTGPDFAFRLDKSVSDAVLKSHTCQIAWNVGLGMELIRHIQIGASYGFGINNVVNKFTDINATDLKVKNNYWTVSAAYLF